MKIAGIIAEYNPLHAGHIYHISHTHADAVVCVMDGAFTQRGEAAIFDKFARVRMALLAGCDAVIELPAVYAVAGAKDFARGGVDILTHIGADEISFGCETDDMSEIEAAADALLSESADFKEKLRNNLAAGMSYPRALGNALNNPLISEPNFILAVEYVKRIKEIGSHITPCVIKRTNNYHTEGASAVRELLRSGNMAAAVKALPGEIREIYEAEAISEPQRHDEAVLAALRNGWAEVWDSEGLGSRINTCARSAGSVDALIEAVKCKRYTWARIRREITRAVLALPEPPDEVPYARLLGIRRDALKLLKALNGITADPVRLKGNPYFEAECRATDFWGLSTDNPAYRVCGRDFTQKFIII